jgi:hypothetical protein
MNGDDLTDQFVGLVGQERADFENWLAGDFLPPQFKEALAKTQDIIATAGNIVGDVSTVVGIFAALIKVIGLLSGPGRDRLDQLAEEIQHTEQLAYSSLKWNMDAHWADVEALAAPASTLLAEFLAPTVPTAGARPGLLTDSQRAQLETEVLAKFRQVLATFLPHAPENIYEIPPYQQVAYEPTTAPDELAAFFPEHEYEERINPATFGITDLLTTYLQLSGWAQRRTVLSYGITGDRSCTSSAHSRRSLRPSSSSIRRFASPAATATRSKRSRRV